MEVFFYALRVEDSNIYDGMVHEMSKIKLGTFIALGETPSTLFKPLGKRRRAKL